MAKKKQSKEIVKAEPSRILPVFDEMEKRFNELLKRPFSFFGPSWWPNLKFPFREELSPSVDIFEEGDDIVVKAEISGMKKEDIDVNLTEDTISISGKKDKEDKIDEKNYYRLERSYGSFHRSFHLPKEVQTDKAAAKFKDGVLEVRIPKTEEAKKKEKKLTIE